VGTIIAALARERNPSLTVPFEENIFDPLTFFRNHIGECASYRSPFGFGA